MRQLPGICATLAAIGDAVLNRPGGLRVFPQGSYQFGAAAPQGGGASGPNSWLIISQDITDHVYDAAHFSMTKSGNGLKYRMTLQAQLAHELDHLNGANHKEDNGVPNTTLTTNTGACADVDVGPGVP